MSSLLLGLISCDIHTERTQKNSSSPDAFDSTSIKSNPVHQSKEKEVKISLSPEYFFSINEKDLNAFIHNHQELVDGIVEAPNLTYACKGNKYHYSSEQGADRYYGLYAHLLQKRNGTASTAEQRKKLTSIYNSINSLFAQIASGGTYFGHQYARIPAHVEYAIWLHKQHNKQFSNPYPVTRQKQLYLSSLRQLIEDELSVDTSMLENEKRKRRSALNFTVDNLGSSITSNFYVQKAKEFHYTFYQYY